MDSSMPEGDDKVPVMPSSSIASPEGNQYSQRNMTGGVSSYGSVSSFDGSAGPSTEAFRTGNPHHRRTPSNSTSLRSSSGVPAQERPRKSPVIRRKPSKLYRGQEFSVLDDASELANDLVKTPSNQNIRGANTLRKRSNVQQQPLVEVDSGEDSQTEIRTPHHDSEGNLITTEDSEDADADARSDVSDAESFTLKDRQQAINQTHPFGIRIWKPALYKKLRSIEQTTEGDIHSVPGERVSPWLFITNILWTLIFGWWLALVAFVGALICFLVAFSPHGSAYGRVFLGLAQYLFYPFGSYVLLESDENYAEEDEGEGRSISEYERWQNGDLEHGRLFFGPIDVVARHRDSIGSSLGERDSLLGHARRDSPEDDQYSRKRRFFGRGEWSTARVVFYAYFYCLVGPPLFLVSLVCWLSVFGIPMGRVSLILFRHLRRHPLALSFHRDPSHTRASGRPSSILLCTYRAAGLKYWKYTIDGTNIFFINLMSVVLLTIFNYFVLHEQLGLRTGLANLRLIFFLGLLSVIPLAYFIGQAVASISAQSSMGLGAAINAFFSTVVEVYLYCVALTEGKSALVEGSIIGSIFAGILFLPGISMCFGALVRKTQRFNDKSAGVTSTMLLFAMIAAFSPTLFYQVHGSHELNCYSCVGGGIDTGRDCRRCYFTQEPAMNDKFYLNAVVPYTYFAAVFLFFSYVIGLWFTLRTHAAMIWAVEGEEKKPLHHNEALNQAEPAIQSATPRHRNNPTNAPAIKDTALFNRILSQSLRNVGLAKEEASVSHEPSQEQSGAPPNTTDTAGSSNPSMSKTVKTPLPGLSKDENELFLRHITEVAATAAAIAARDASRIRRPSGTIPTISKQTAQKVHAPPSAQAALVDDEVGAAAQVSAQTGGHDAPNWSKAKSSVILLGATVLYAIIAEILVKTVDVILASVDVEEKFLGITLFALVPNTTEFLNAISFAMNGNIALSMEIGSAYALQVCLLQIPALVFFSAIYAHYVDPAKLLTHTFSLIFPQWDMITIILCVFLLSYMYGEGKSNYFKGSILVLTYLCVIIGFHLSGYNSVDQLSVDSYDTLALMQSATFRTMGRGNSGRAF